MTTIAVVQTVALVVAVLVIGTGLLQNMFYLMLLCISGVALMRRPPVERFGLLWQRYADDTLPITIIVPAHNEELTITHNVRSLLALGYPSIELLVVNDGSTDKTLDVMRSTFGLEPAVRDAQMILTHKLVRGIYTTPTEQRLVVIDKENGGKADAMNCAINFARSPLVCVIDADSLLEPDSLLRAVRYFVDDPERTVAVGATVRVANGCRIERGHVIEVELPRNLLALFQTLEYLRAFLMGRLGWSAVDLSMVVAGAFGIFRRQTLLDVGGYSLNTVGEDMELIVKIHRYMRDHGLAYRVLFVPEPICWTEAPETLRQLGRQRARWARGAIETFFTHWDMALNPRYGRIGSVGLFNMFLVDVLGPPVEILGYILCPAMWSLGILATDYFLAFLAVTVSFGIAISAGSLALEELELRRYPRARDLLVLFVVAVVENFGYRQLNNLWRLRGWWQYLRGTKGWGVQTRQGFKRS